MLNLRTVYLYDLNNRTGDKHGNEKPHQLVDTFFPPLKRIHQRWAQGKNINSANHQ